MVVNCAGLYCDKVAACAIPDLDVRIVPFRGEYHTLKEGRRGLVRNLVYPVPDPDFPFLGVHFTRRLDGAVEAGPNAVLALRREGYGKFPGQSAGAVRDAGLERVPHRRPEILEDRAGGNGPPPRAGRHRKRLAELVPEIRPRTSLPGAGVRAQACDAAGALLDDFLIRELPGQVHVLNAPSPAATSSLAIGEAVADLALAAVRRFVARASELQADPRRKNVPVDVRLSGERRLDQRYFPSTFRNRNASLKSTPAPAKYPNDVSLSDPPPSVSSFVK